MAKPSRADHDQPDTLLLSTGDLASFVSLLAVRRPDLALVVPTTDDTDVLRRIVRQAELAGARLSPDAIAPAGDDFHETRLLLDACALAKANRCARVIWPVFCAAEIDPIALALDRARLVSTLAALDARPKGVAIETPVLDLSDAQLADLAVDVGVPAQPGWITDAEEERWLTLLRAADARRRQPV